MMNDGTDVVGQDFRGLVEEAERDGSSLRDILLSEEARKGWRDTPLHLACREGHRDVVSLILTSCKVNSSHDPLLTATNNAGATPLHSACWGRHRDVVFLILTSCMVNSSQDPLLIAEDYVGQTPLDVASEDLRTGK
jgi:ankyrin repeat protein